MRRLTKNLTFPSLIMIFFGSIAKKIGFGTSKKWTWADSHLFSLSYSHLDASQSSPCCFTFYTILTTLLSLLHRPLTCVPTSDILRVFSFSPPHTHTHTLHTNAHTYTHTHAHTHMQCIHKFKSTNTDITNCASTLFEVRWLQSQSAEQSRKTWSTLQGDINTFPLILCQTQRSPSFLSSV